MTEPAERELMPGVFITDFRSSATATSTVPPTTAAAAATSTTHRTATHEEHERKDSDSMNDDDPSIASTASPSSAPLNLARPFPSTFPLDIPNDVETLELEYDAIEKNLVQLIKTNLILEEELKENPNDQDYIDSLRENRVILFRRSDQLNAIRAQLKLLAPHRTEAPNSEQQQMTTEIERQRQEERNQPPQEQEQGGLFL